MPGYHSALTHLYEGATVWKLILADTVLSSIQHTTHWPVHPASVFVNTAAALCNVTTVITLSTLKFSIILI